VARLHLLRGFCDEHGEAGNPLAVFLDGVEVPAASRQAVAGDLGLSETVFVDDAGRGELRIFTPAVELPFAGHPTVGTAWLLAAVEIRQGRGSRIATRPLDDGYVEVGGASALDDVRDYQL
jgi:PhzF family phenazine biosynthesis protein